MSSVVEPLTSHSFAFLSISAYEIGFGGGGILVGGLAIGAPSGLISLSLKP